MDSVKTGNFIKQLRNQQNLTQKQLADKLGCTDKAVSRWETGKGFPDVSYLLDLAEILNVGVNEILIGEKIGKGNLEQINNAIIVNTMSDSNKKINKLKIAVFILLCVLLISAYYIPVAIMTPSDTMGVIFFHIIGSFVISFFTGFVNLKIKWLFPIFCFVCYFPMMFIFESMDLVYYALFFIALGYVTQLIATGVQWLFSVLKSKIKKK